jgi:hypothetical protein
MRITGFFLVIFSLVMLVVNRFSPLPSDALGRLICPTRYLQPVNGVVGDPSCGFNLDIYLAVALLLTGLAGAILLRLARRKTANTNK